MSKHKELTDEEIRQAFSYHKWELKQAILYCFGINPKEFDWEKFENQNSDVMRIYNWCLHKSHGGTVPSDKSFNKINIADLTTFSVQVGNGTDVMVLRDEFIKFFHKGWPDFCKRTYSIWREYRREKDIDKLSEVEKDRIFWIKCLAVAEYRKNKSEYLKGAKFPSQNALAKKAASVSIHKEGVLRKASSYGPENWFEWAKLHADDAEYLDKF